ncbi:MAG: hypothetical protein H6R40_1532, partial [Gemmatimonadetes bacterium]|nr:hypothetical protein [Gemmatimonadota bacterium]
MLLHDVDIIEGSRPDRLRIQARVRYDADGQEEPLWFELPATLEAEVSRDGTPWLAALLPLAATLQEPLRVEAPVDGVLLEGCHRLLEVWSAWFPHLPPVAIEATPLTSDRASRPAGTGLFFSGGVDSFFSLLRHNGPQNPGTRPRVTDLVLIHGMDIPLSNEEAFARLRPRMETVAGQFGAGLVDIATNLRETRWRRADWGQLSHGALLMGAGLLLESRYARLLVASSAAYSRLQPCGSHPITDPLFSTSRTRVWHDGAAADRPDKIQAIAADPTALKYLRVCWLGRSDTNCGCCPKCVLAMVG